MRLRGARREPTEASAGGLASQIVLTGLRDSGKTSVACRLVASLLNLQRRTAVHEKEVERVRVEEEETLTGAADDGDALFTADERAAQEYGDVCLTAEGRRSLAAAERQPCADLLPLVPTAVSTRITTRKDGGGSGCAVRVTVEYRAEKDVARLISRGRLAFNLSGGPDLDVEARQDAKAKEEEVEKANKDDVAEDNKGSSCEEATGCDSASSSSEDPDARKTAIGPREIAEIAAVLGCAPCASEVGAALSDRTRSYLPSRFRDLLGKKRVSTFAVPGGRDDPTAVAAAMKAARMHIHRVACGAWSRWGCIAGDVVVEVPFRHELVSGTSCTTSAPLLPISSEAHHCKPRIFTPAIRRPYRHPIIF